MAELNFIDYDANTIVNQVLTDLENGVAEPLYPGDERRIFGEALAQVIVAVYNSVNDACRQKMLRYARGDVLDAIGENRDVERIVPEYAETVLRFSVDSSIKENIIIPKGVRATSDFVRYFATSKTAVLYAGSMYVDVEAVATEGGAYYNSIPIGEISNLVDTSEAPLIDSVTNLEETHGGGDEEEDEAYRARIRESENKISTAGTAKAYRYWGMSSNSLVSDVAVVSDVETLEETLTVYDAHAFRGGDRLEANTLVVYKSDGTQAATGSDYTYTYEDDLLTITLLGDLASYETVDIKLNRDMAGRVKIIPICAGGELPDEDVLEDVYNACSADDVKPLTDIVEVEAPKVQYYDIDLEYWTTAANESEVIENIEGDGGAISQYVYWQGSTLDQDINPDMLVKLCLCPHWSDDQTGATRVIVNSPVYTELDATTVAKCSGTITVKHYVKG